MVSYPLMVSYPWMMYFLWAVSYPQDDVPPLGGVLHLGDAPLKDLTSPILVLILISPYSTVKLADCLPNIKL